MEVGNCHELPGEAIRTSKIKEVICVNMFGDLDIDHLV